jgi:hypothetical protein
VTGLSFCVTDVLPQANSFTPTLTFRLNIEDAAARSIHAILLRSQLQIEPRRRKHSPVEQARLNGIFGTPDRWKDTLRSLNWTQISATLPAFSGTCTVDLPVPCTYDVEVAAAKYLYSLDDGEVALLFLFSGTVFVKTGDGFQVEQIPWDREAGFRMPVRVWRELMELCFPGCGWIRLGHESLEQLQQFRTRHGLLNWDETVEALIRAAEEVTP